MYRWILVVGAVILMCDVSNATPQLPDTLVFGGRKYAIQEVPMLGLWDYETGGDGNGRVEPPAFEVRSSANWARYRATFEIRDSKLYLRRITGRIGGKKCANEEIIPGERFPIVATWYTGRIHLDVGDFDIEATAVIIF